jgi:protein ImuB
MCSMHVAVLLPRFPLLVAMLGARRPLDVPAALAPVPDGPAVIGECTPAARDQGVRPGLRLGEALARCPALELVPPDPAAVEDAHERLLRRLEAIGAAVEPGDPGVAVFLSDGLERLHGGLDGVLRQTRAALPVGADGRVGVAPSRFAALQAAHAASPRRPLVVPADGVAEFLAPLPVERLPLDPRLVTDLYDLGLRTMGAVAALPHAAALERLGFAGVAAWRLARGGDDRPLRPRVPPETLEARITFPDPVGTLPALQAAARLLLRELGSAARGRGTAVRGVGVRARLVDDGSWVHEVVLREATTDPDRLALAVLPHLERIAAPVVGLALRAVVSGAFTGHQLSVVRAGRGERGRRVEEAVGQVRATLGDRAVMRVVELEPWTRLPERRWALIPFDTSHLPDRSA